jgi:hypothetical protein
MVDCSCSVPVFNMDGLRVAKNASDIEKGVNQGRYVARLCPYTSGSGEIYPTTGKKRIGIKLSYVSKTIHRKDGYSYA